MKKAFLFGNNLAFCRHEALDLAEGLELIEGTFFASVGNWTGVFVARNGDSYRIYDGYVDLFKVIDPQADRKSTKLFGGIEL